MTKYKLRAQISPFYLLNKKNGTIFFVLIIVIAFLSFNKQILSENRHSAITQNIKPELSDTVLSINPQAENERWGNMIDKIGAEKAYTKFKDEYNSKHFSVQHIASHVMGSLLFEKEGINGLAVCDASFAFGCYHSFFGKALGEKSTAIIPQLNQACLDKYGPLGTGCFHGIGHGLLDFFGPSKLVQALNSCLLTTQSNPLFGCTSGVFMEYNVPIVISDTNSYSDPRKLNPGSPYSPCPDVPDQFQKSCYFEMPLWWNIVFAHDFLKFGSLCQDLSKDIYRESCFLGIGNIAGPGSDYRVSDTINKCHLMPSEDSTLICLSGAMWSFYADPRYRADSEKICQGLNENQKNQCVTKSNLIGDKSLNAQN